MRRAPLAVALVLALAGVAGAVCGDRVLDAGEQCDDGNTLAGDCCSATCQFEPLGTSCDDKSMCTVSDTCNGAGVCGSAVHLSCDDQKPCTLESCHPADGCHHDPVDFTATLVELGTPLAMGDCSGKRVPGSIKGRFVAAGKLVGKGQRAASMKTRLRLVNGAASQLKKAQGAIKRPPKSLAAACLDDLRKRVNTALSRTLCLRNTL
jgi:cysteine-rich repeat protein